MKGSPAPTHRLLGDYTCLCFVAYPASFSIDQLIDRRLRRVVLHDDQAVTQLDLDGTDALDLL